MNRAGLVALALLLLAVIASAISVVYARQESRRLFVEVTRLTHERDDLNVEFGRLQLEQATWSETNRIEQIARGQLGLIAPGPADAVVIKR